jgi:hypothetical protein
VRLEGLDQLKIPVNSSGIDPHYLSPYSIMPLPNMVKKFLNLLADFIYMSHMIFFASKFKISLYNLMLSTNGLAQTVEVTVT